MGVPELGIAGGMAAGANIALFVDRKHELGLPVGRVTGLHSVANAGGEISRLGPKTKAFPVKAGDVLAFCSQGAAGYGDPLDREPDRVRLDVVNGFVSVEMAAQCYGVILADGAVDQHATELERGKIRRVRLNGTVPKRPPSDLLQHPLRALRIDENCNFLCRCGQILGKRHENWNKGSATRTTTVARALVLEPCQHNCVTSHLRC
jgi:hypothetical protein